MKDYNLNKKYKVNLELTIKLDKVVDYFDGMDFTVLDSLEDNSLIEAAINHLEDKIKGPHTEEEKTVFDYLHFNVKKVKGNVIKKRKE